MKHADAADSTEQPVHSTPPRGGSVRSWKTKAALAAGVGLPLAILALGDPAAADPGIPGMSYGTKTDANPSGMPDTGNSSQSSYSGASRDSGSGSMSESRTSTAKAPKPKTETPKTAAPKTETPKTDELSSGVTVTAAPEHGYDETPIEALSKGSAEAAERAETKSAKSVAAGSEATIEGGTTTTERTGLHRVDTKTRDAAGELTHSTMSLYDPFSGISREVTQEHGDAEEVVKSEVFTAGPAGSSERNSVTDEAGTFSSLVETDLSGNKTYSYESNRDANAPTGYDDAPLNRSPVASQLDESADDESADDESQSSSSRFSFFNSANAATSDPAVAQDSVLPAADLDDSTEAPEDSYDDAPIAALSTITPKAPFDPSQLLTGNRSNSRRFSTNENPVVTRSPAGLDRYSKELGFGRVHFPKDFQRPETPERDDDSSNPEPQSGSATEDATAALPNSDLAEAPASGFSFFKSANAATFEPSVPVDAEPSAVDTDSDSSWGVNPRTADDGSTDDQDTEIITTVKDGVGGYTATVTDLAGNIVRQSIVEGNMDERGNAMVTAFEAATNITTVSLSDYEAEKQYVTTIDHNSFDTLTETVDESGMPIGESDLSVDTAPAALDTGGEPAVEVSDIATIGTDNEIIEGTNFTFGQFKGAYKAADPTPPQEEVLRAAYDLPDPSNEENDEVLADSTNTRWTW